VVLVLPPCLPASLACPITSSATTTMPSPLPALPYLSHLPRLQLARAIDEERKLQGQDINSLVGGGGWVAGDVRLYRGA
jgi:hypothetical protein